MQSLCIWAVAWGLAAPVPDDQSDQGQTQKSGRVRELFEQMRAGKYQSIDFPALKWDDIPDLLEMGKSKRVLKSFPRNFLSSQLEFECSEGMVAMWLIEGLRKGGKFATLNALCLSEKPTKKWAEDSERNHPQVLKAYQAWWKQVQSLPAHRARELDPLQGTKLYWY